MWCWWSHFFMQLLFYIIQRDVVSRWSFLALYRVSSHSSLIILIPSAHCMVHVIWETTFRHANAPMATSSSTVVQFDKNLPWIVTLQLLKFVFFQCDAWAKVDDIIRKKSVDPNLVLWIVIVLWYYTVLLQGFELFLEKMVLDLSVDIISGTSDADFHSWRKKSIITQATTWLERTLYNIIFLPPTTEQIWLPIIHIRSYIKSFRLHRRPTIRIARRKNKVS